MFGLLMLNRAMLIRVLISGLSVGILGLLGCVLVFSHWTHYAASYNPHLFAKVRVGMERPQVHALIGQPLSTSPHSRYDKGRHVPNGTLENYSKPPHPLAANYWVIYVMYDPSDRVSGCVVKSESTETVYALGESGGFVKPEFWNTGRP